MICVFRASVVVHADKSHSITQEFPIEIVSLYFVFVWDSRGLLDYRSCSEFRNIKKSFLSKSVNPANDKNPTSQ